MEAPLATARERSVILDGRRLETLRLTRLLDAEPPDDLQRLVDLVRRCFGVAVSYVSLVDSHRQFFAAQSGLPAPFSMTRENPLDSSFCRHVVTSGKPLVVADARVHPLVHDNGAIELLGVVAYAGMPIVAGDGACLGAFCIAEPHPRSWTTDELADLADLAATASALIEARVEHSRLTNAEREKLDLINRITEGFACFDRDWRVTFANGVAAAMTRRPPEETIGRTLWELIPELEGTRIADGLRYAMAQHGTHEFEWRGDVHRGWWEVRAVSSPDGLSLYLRDITRRKDSERAIKQSESRFRTLFEKSHEPLLLADACGIVDGNDAAARLLGCSARDEMMGANLLRFIPPDQPDGRPSRERLAEVAAALRQGEACHFDWTLSRVDGALFPAEVSLVPIDLGSGASVLISLHDLSLRVEQERMLLRAKDAAEATTRAKSDFLARMSHELRSPLNSIIGFSRLLMRAPGGGLDDQAHTYLDRIHANGVHLLALINDVLDISRIEAGRPDLRRERIDLSAVIRETMEQGEGLVAGRPVRLLADVAPGVAFVEGDPHKLRRVLINLVGNAVKFTCRGEVTTRLIVAPDGTPEAIEVEDTGIGIPADKLEAIFEPFEQVESGTSRRYDGSGLGLAISRQLCTLMGYTLTVRSTPGAGSTFRIGLRAA